MKDMVGNKFMKLKNELHIGKNDIIAMGLMLLALLILMQYRTYRPFLDESDNFLGGKILSRGGVIYKDYISQHMPGMYYIVGIIVKLGFTEIQEIRTCFYLLIFLSWIVMYFRYKNIFSLWIIPTFVFMYLSMFSISKGHTLLAEQIEIIAFMVIMCELFLFFKTKKLKLSSTIFISISTWLAIVCAMTAVWTIFFMALIFIIIYIEQLKSSENKKNIMNEIIRTSVIIAIPFIIWMVYLLKTNSVEEWFYQAYKFNQEVYGKYVNFSGIFKTVIAPFFGYGSMIWKAIQQLTVSLYSSVIILVYVVVNILFCIEMSRKGKIYGILMFVTIIAMGNRSFGIWSSDENMHATPYLAMTGFMLAYLLFEVWNVRKVTIIMLTFLMVVPITSALNEVSEYNNNIKYVETSDTAKYINALTKKNEKIFLVGFNEYNDYNAYNRMPATRLVHIHPWFMEEFQQDVINDLEKNKTRVIVNAEDMDIWGYKYVDYAASLRNYILQNYTQIGKSEANVWVRNDYYEKAFEKLNYDNNMIVPNNEELKGITSINGKRVSQCFVPKVKKLVKISTYITINGDIRDGYYMVDLYSQKDKKCIYSSVVPISGIVDGWQMFELDDVKVTPGNKYEVRISVAGVSETCNVNIGVIKNNASLKTKINNKLINQDLALRVYGK